MYVRQVKSDPCFYIHVRQQVNNTFLYQHLFTTKLYIYIYPQYTGELWLVTRPGPLSTDPLI